MDYRTDYYIDVWAKLGTKVLDPTIGAQAQMGVSQFTIRGAIWTVAIMRRIIFWDLCWDPPILGNYQIAAEEPIQLVCLPKGSM